MPPCCASGSVAIGPIHAARLHEWQPKPIVAPDASRAANAVPRSIATIELVDPVRVRARGEVERTGAGFTLDDDAGRRFAPERRRDRHVDPDQVPVEAERLEAACPARVLVTSTPGHK